MALLSVAEALALIVDGAAPLGAEPAPIEAALGRTLAADLAARLTQPPFDASAMDGYAVRSADVVRLPVHLAVVGEAAAGHPFAGRICDGQAIRILTGAPVPAGADAIVIQENATREGGTIVVREGVTEADHIRRRGFDFQAGMVLLPAGRRLGARELALAAAMGHGSLVVRRRPLVAILSTGDELVAPGETPGPGQIVSSNHLGVAALAEQAGAMVRQLGIARDTRPSLEAHIARAADADVLVTIGGASVGDHDLVGPVLQANGLSLAFWKIAMRPGKPLMFGRRGGQAVLGLPGNPVSALVCARIFLVPLLHALAGRPRTAEATCRARVTTGIGENGPRQHYMRATTGTATDGTTLATPVRSQDSSLLSPLAIADCFIVRRPGAGAVAAGGDVEILPLEL